ncbi:MAG TPA: 16S rRNA pseudouridine(516) synthase [Ruminococcaceae bacterium]|jgi:16S rRNA pseudouridine516 synthase|nr:16S rRNA pseudouridine(516) synthase [Oscillospiraceae bacterium]
MLQRLDKLIASQGRFSRREVQELIKNGAVKVNGITVRDRGAKSDDEKDIICVNGEQLDFQRFVYIMLNKPKGVVSATNDKNEKTVIDLVPKEFKGRNLFPAGRLDITTTGFVLVTDDGDFAHRILSPKNHIEKTYEARLAESVTEGQLEAVRNGIELKDGTKCLPAKVTVLADGEKPVVEIKICEGKYHQIKRMFAAAGNGVIELKRTQMGKLTLDPSLKEGECRLLDAHEVQKIEKG